MIVDDSTLVPDKSKGTSLKSNLLLEELRTMVINSDGEDDSTMKSINTKLFIRLILKFNNDIFHKLYFRA